MLQHFYPSQEKQGVIGVPRGTGNSQSRCSLPGIVAIFQMCNINNIFTECQLQLKYMLFIYVALGMQFVWSCKR